jgi:hypothetical protein
LALPRPPLPPPLFAAAVCVAAAIGKCRRCRRRLVGRRGNGGIDPESICGDPIAMSKISKIELGLIATFITVGLLGAYAAVLPVPLVIP